MLRKILATLLVTSILLSVLSLGALTASAAQSGTWGNLTWTLDDEGTLTISGEGEMKSFDYFSNSFSTSGWRYYINSIKTVVIDNGITFIGNYAFYNCAFLGSVTIPDSVTCIGGYAFQDCSSLKSVTIPDSVTYIETQAFCECTSLENITVPDSITCIGESVFSDTAYYNNESNWENDVLYIGKYLLEAKKPIAGDYVIKDGAKCIADNAFLGCTALESTTIPDSVAYIGNNAFSSCGALESITIPNSITYLGTSAFSHCGSLTSVTISYGIAAIGDRAFEYCTALKNITIPDSVTYIGNGALNSCYALENVTIPDSVTSISHNAFFECTSLKSIIIPDSVTSIGTMAFYGCTALENITIPDSVACIGYEAFSFTKHYNNENNWENDALYIGKHLIRAKKSITGDYIIKDGTNCIVGGAFYDCEALDSVTIPDSVTFVGDRAFCDCTALEDITIPDSVTFIGWDAFDNTAYYNNKSNWENDVLYIGKYLVKAKEYITGDCVIKDGTKCIADSAFRECEFLESVTIPDSVITIGITAFYCCYSLESITIPDSVTCVGEDAFTNTAYYNNQSNWGNDVLYIGKCLIYAKKYLTGDYVIRDETKCIANNAFETCHSLKSVTIPDNVAFIGNYAFTSSANYAYYGCINLETVYYGGSKAQWNAITIGVCNDELLNANIIFASEPEIETGDVNNDGGIDNLDALMVLKYDAGVIDLDENELIAADVNVDGEADNLDALKILKYDAGIIDEL